MRTIKIIVNVYQLDNGKKVGPLDKIEWDIPPDVQLIGSAGSVNLIIETLAAGLCFLQEWCPDNLERISVHETDHSVKYTFELLVN